MRFLTILLALAALAQNPSAPRRFEVASIRLRTGQYGRIDITTSGNRLNAEAESARGLILWAYSLKNYQLPDMKAPQPVEEAVYDIVARAEGESTPSKAEFRQMLQALLAERFQLRVHREMREMPVYELVVSKGGPKLKVSGESDDSPAGNVGVHGRNQTFAVTKASMDAIAQQIWDTFFLDRPVLNKTGLTGIYDVRMEATPEFRISRGPEQDDLSVFAAVQEQLGLKLESAKAPIELLVVDHIEKPSEN